MSVPNWEEDERYSGGRGRKVCGCLFDVVGGVCSLRV